MLMAANGSGNRAGLAGAGLTTPGLGLLQTTRTLRAGRPPAAWAAWERNPPAPSRPTGAAALDTIPHPVPAGGVGGSAAWRLRRWLEARLSRPRAPLVLLGIVVAVGVGARVFHLDIPSETKPGEGFVFDEKYYVNAARVMAGVPMHATDTYANASPAGTDPNGEHPQLGKLIIAATIRIFGDNPIGWRIGAVIFGAAALLLLYWLVRTLGLSSWLALGATAVAAVENLWLVSGRIAVLDIFCVPFMLAGVAFYLRRRPIVAGLLIGIGTCIKEFALYAVLAIVLLELMRGARWLLAERGVSPWRGWRRGLSRVVSPLTVIAVSVAAFATLLAVLDHAVTPYHDGHPVDNGQASVCRIFGAWGGACNHIAFMDNYAANLRSPNGPQGIASYPWQFWGDVEPIDYYTVKTTVTVGSTVTAVNTVVTYKGEIDPVVLVTAWIAILVTVAAVIRRRDDVSFFIVAWIIGTWLPAEVSSLVGQRTTYLYYMVVTMPALYIAVARLLSRRVIPRWLVGVWVGGLLASFAVLYPFRTLTGT
jgi:dolichyl-phosphate-mannose-protein mannosyltransferase